MERIRAYLRRRPTANDRESSVSVPLLTTAIAYGQFVAKIPVDTDTIHIPFNYFRSAMGKRRAFSHLLPRAYG
jgi:hypothetical protein